MGGRDTQVVEVRNLRRDRPRRSRSGEVMQKAKDEAESPDRQIRFHNKPALPRRDLVDGDVFASWQRS